MSADDTLQARTSRFVDLGGVKVHYHELGEGPVLMLLHGSGPGASGWANFSRNIEVLSKRFRVICPDMPGFGKSDMKPVDAPMPGWWTDITRALMDALKIERAHFVGNSMGGMIALKLALESPERVGRLILMGSGGGIPLFTPFPTEGIKTLVGFYDGPGPSIERLKAFVQQFVYDPSQLTDELLAMRLEAAMDPRVMAQPPMRPGPGGPPEELWRDPRLARLPHDIMLMWGREDRVMPLDGAFVLLKLIPKARLYVLPQCGHWAQWEHADEFNQVVAGFVSPS